MLGWAILVIDKLFFWILQLLFFDAFTRALNAASEKRDFFSSQEIIFRDSHDNSSCFSLIVPDKVENNPTFVVSLLQD